MTRAAFLGAIVLVEGPTDSRFLKRHLIAGKTQITICGGKQTALSAINQMAAFPLAGYLAVVDRDFDDHRGLPAIHNVFLADAHDTETMLLSARLQTVAEEVGDQQKIDNFQAKTGRALSDAVLERVEGFTKLRFLNEVRPAFQISMDRFSPWKYTDSATWKVDESALQVDFAAICGKPHAELQVLLASLPPLASWRDSQGHQSLAILSIGLRNVLGNDRQVSENQLCSSLRFAFSEQDFQKTELYGQLKGWEDLTGLPLLSH